MGHRRAPTPTLRLIALLALMLAVAPLVAGDWPTYLHDPQRSSTSADETYLSPANAAQLIKTWTFQTGAPVESSPTVVSGTVYIGSWDGYEYALDETTGALKWKTLLGTTTATCGPTRGVSSSAAVQNGVLYVGGGDSYWYALDATTGAVLWRILLGSTANGLYNWSSPLLYNGYAYVGVASYGDCPLVQGELLQVNLASHQVTQVFKAVPDGQTGATIWDSPSLDAATNTLYVATGNQGQQPASSQPYAMAVIALDATTLSVKSWWQIPPSQDEGDSDFGSAPTLFVDAAGHQLVGIANKNGVFYAFDRANIAAGPLWQQRIATSATGFPSGIAPAAFSNGVLYVGGADYPSQGHVRALDPATGTVAWVHSAPGNIFGAVAYANGLVVDAAGNTLEVLNAATGAPLYSYATGGEVSASPSIANGQVFEGSQDDTVYAFGVPQGPLAALAPSSLSFAGQVLATSSLTQTVTLTNAGTAPLTVTNVTLGGANPGDFSLVANTCTGTALPPAAACTMGLRFTPTATGNRAATLNIADNAYNTPQSVSLAGTGLPAPCAPSGTPLAAPYARTVLADAPVAYWRLDEGCAGTVVDGSGDGRYGETAGGVTADAPGAIAADSDTAMSLDGTSGIISVSDLDGIPAGSSSYTLEAWVRLIGTTNPLGTFHGFIGYGNYGTFGQINSFRDNGCNGLDNSWWNDDLDATFSTNLCDGVYHHVVATYDAASGYRTIYLDGSQVGQDHPAPPAIQRENLTLGKTWSNEYLHGSLDEVAIYDYALSAARVLAHYQAGVPILASVAPSSIDFGTQVYGSPGVTQTVTLTSAGTQPLTVTGVAISGADPGDFAASSDTCLGATLAPGSACTIGLRFTPAALGSRGAALTITDNASGGTQSVALSGASILGANLVADGDFETPAVPPHLNDTVYAPSSFDAWSVISGSIDLAGTYWQNASGNQSVDLNGASQGAIAQSIATTPGARYLLRFAMAGNPQGGPAIKLMSVLWGATAVATLAFTTTGRSASAMGWTYYTLPLIASTPSTQLRFQSLTAGYYGPTLDDVSLVTQTAALTVTPAVGVFLSPLTFTGASFAPGESVTIAANSVGATALYSATADATGSFTLRTAGRALPYGANTLIAVGQSSGHLAAAGFLMLPRLTLQPAVGRVGAVVVETEMGFGMTETVTLHWATPSGAVLGVATSNARGSAAGIFAVPLSSAGLHAVYAIGQSSGARAVAYFTVR